MKKIYKTAIWSLILLLLPIGFLSHIRAEDKITAEQIIGKILENYGKIQTYRDKGTIEIKTGGMKTTIETEFIYKRPDKFYLSGWEQKIISDGKKTWFYSKASNRYIEDETNETAAEAAERISPVFGIIKKGRECLVEGWDKETKNWTLSGGRINQDDFYLLEIPLAENKGEQRLWVNKSSFMIEKIETRFKGEAGGEMLIAQVFQDIKINIPVADNTFLFSPPAGAKKETSPFAGQKSEWTGKKVLDFTLPAIGGKPVKLSGCRGRVVVLCFWDTECMPCLEELGTLEKIYQDYKNKGLALFGVNSEYNEYRIIKTAKEKGVTFPILHDKEKEIAAFYEVNVIPRLMIIDKEGIIRVDSVGALPDNKIRQELLKLGVK